MNPVAGDGLPGSGTSSRTGGFGTRTLLAATVSLVLMATLVVAVGGGVADADGGRSATAVWIGSPISGRWPNADGCRGATYPSSSCSLPYAHHTYYYGDAYRGDFGLDLQSVSAGTNVYLYAAPQNTAYNGQITAHVKNVTPACGRRSGETRSQQLRRGGYAVVVELRHSGSVVGTVKYVHINPSVQKGQTISRWGTKVGTVGNYVSNGCWSGVHLHMEMTNQRHYACYNRGYSPGQRIYRTNFVGFLGGHFAYSPRARCP